MRKLIDIDSINTLILEIFNTIEIEMSLFRDVWTKRSF